MLIPHKTLSHNYLYNIPILIMKYHENSWWNWVNLIPLRSEYKGHRCPSHKLPPGLRGVSDDATADDSAPFRLRRDVSGSRDVRAPPVRGPAARRPLPLVRGVILGPKNTTGGLKDWENHGFMVRKICKWLVLWWTFPPTVLRKWKPGTWATDRFIGSMGLAVGE